MTDRIATLRPVYSGRKYLDFKNLLNTSMELYGERDAFIIKHRKENITEYQHVSFSDFAKDTEALGTGMLNCGFLGKRIAIIGKNSYEWMLTYFSTLGGLGISVPLDKGLPYEELKNSLIRSYSDVLVYDRDHKELVEQLKADNLTQVKEYISMEEVLPALIEEGHRLLKTGNNDYRNLPVDGEAMSVICLHPEPHLCQRLLCFRSATFCRTLRPCS